MADLIQIPTFAGSVRQRFLLEPLGGPKDTFYYLERFPSEIFHKSPDTHLYKFMRSLLGESGVNWIKKNYLEARILLEEHGIDLFDVDKFFGDPLRFGRILEESFDEDPYGLIPRDKWEEIKAKNARYRNRALDFVNGARAGNTPTGMRMVARAGLGHDAEIIENYRYLYDVHSDDPLGLQNFGKTTSTEEMIVLPRQEFGAYESPTEIEASHQYHLQQAVDRIRPQTTIMTIGEARGLRERNDWNAVYASSEYTEVIRYVTGSSGIRWPSPTATYWIEPQVEKEAPKLYNDLQHHYTGFHNVNSVTSSSNAITINGELGVDRILADYAEPLLVTSASELRTGATSFINGIYPIEYRELPGVPPIRYAEEQFWASLEREDDEWVQINFSIPKAVNYLSLDIESAPVRIDIEYDAYDGMDEYLFVPVVPVEPYGNILSAGADLNPWVSIGLTFTNRKQELIFTRSLKIKLTRQQMYSGSLKIKNLRVARNV